MATSTRSWAAAARAAPPLTPVSSSSSSSNSVRERPPVGLRPVTQQQLEARHLRRVASTPPDTALSTRRSTITTSSSTGNSSSYNSMRGARGAAAAAAAAAASDDDDDGWTSVASKSRWNRSHKRAVPPPPRAAASETPPPPTISAPYYSWATTAAASAGAAAPWPSSAPGAAAAASLSKALVTKAPPREESTRALSLKLSLKLQPAAGASPKREYGRRAAATVQRSRSLDQNARGLRRSSPPAALGGELGIQRNTSLQKLLAKIEFEDEEAEQQFQAQLQQHQQQYQQSSRRRNDQGGSQEAPRQSSATSTTAEAGAKAATAPQKCGDKRDFFFRNLEFETRNRLQIDDVAGFSVTEHEMATKISEAIVELFARGAAAPEEAPPLVVTDATACVGGNVISFCDYFAIVNAVECDLTRCEMLQHNLAVLGKSNALCIHASYLMVMHDLQQDVVFIDPPWGGPEYKDLAKVDLFLDDVPLYDICRQLHGRAQLVVLKVPTNFDADKFAEHVPGNVAVRKDFHKMHLVVVDFREARSEDEREEEASAAR